MKKLKILYTIPNFDTAGSGKVVYDLVKGLDKTRFEPEILVKHTRGDFFKEVEKLGVPIHVFNYETDYYPLWSFPLRLWKVVRFFKGLDIDIIHSWHWSSDFSETLAARLAGIKYVFTKKNMGWGNKAWVLKSKLSHQVIAINKDMLKVFFNPITAINAKYLPLGIDTEYYKPKVFDLNLANQLGIKKTDFVLISVANLVSLKGIENLINAFQKLSLSNAKLLIVGNNQNDYGTSLMNNYKDKNIIFTGKQIDVRPFLSLADVFCIPTLSIGEGMPLAPVEAMSMGVPVIGSKVSGITDVLEGFEEWIFEVGNEQELALKLKNINELTSEERVHLGHRMRNKVLSVYSFNHFILSREKLYKLIVE
jgi:glycosyltransferase involved in cell wall biosynthesis